MIGVGDVAMMDSHGLRGIGFNPLVEKDTDICGPAGRLLDFLASIEVVIAVYKFVLSGCRTVTKDPSAPLTPLTFLCLLGMDDGDVWKAC
jgi:hypothetical protein